MSLAGPKTVLSQSQIFQKVILFAKASFMAACTFLLTGCWDYDVEIGIYDVRSAQDKRLSSDATHGVWGFKYTSKGSWDISCRPPGPASALGLNYWTSLSRSPESEIPGTKKFVGSRTGDTVELFIWPNGGASIRYEQDGDTIIYNLRTHEYAMDKSPFS